MNFECNKSSHIQQIKTFEHQILLFNEATRGKQTKYPLKIGWSKLEYRNYRIFCKLKEWCFESSISRINLQYIRLTEICHFQKLKLWKNSTYMRYVSKSNKQKPSKQKWDWHKGWEKTELSLCLHGYWFCKCKCSTYILLNNLS